MDSLQELNKAIDAYTTRKREYETTLDSERKELQAKANAIISKIPPEQINSNWDKVQKVLGDMQ